MALCRITGKVYLPDGSEAANRVVEFYMLPSGALTSQYLGVVSPEPIKARLDADGNIDVSLVTNNYLVNVLDRNGKQQYQAKATVPEQDTAQFSDIIEAGDPVLPLPSWLQGAWEARDEALDAVALAEQAALDAQEASLFSFNTLPDFMSSSDAFPDGSFVATKTNDSFRVVNTGSGDYDHPITGQGLEPQISPVQSALLARDYDLHTSNSGSRNYAALQLALDKVSARSGGGVYVPAGIFAVSGRIQVPNDTYLKGAAWNKTRLDFNTASGGIGYSSGSIIEDLDIRGTNVAEIGIEERDNFNRASISRLRVQDFVDYGFGCGMVAQANNSLFQDVQVKACQVNFALMRALNIVFLNCNGDQRTLAEGGNAGQRNIKVYDSGSVDPNDQTRNTRFIGGIFERGIGDYQIEVERCLGMLMVGVEANGAVVSAIRHGVGDLRLVSPHFTSTASSDRPNAMAIIAPDGPCYVNGPAIVSGQNGRMANSFFSGAVYFDGDIMRPISQKGRFGTILLNGDATNTATGNDIVTVGSVTGGAANRVGSRAADGIYPPGVSTTYEVEIIATAVSGTPSAYLAHQNSPFRTLLGEVTVGVNRFTITSENGSPYGEVQIYGGSAWSAGIKAVTVKAL